MLCKSAVARDFSFWSAQYEAKAGSYAIFFAMGWKTLAKCFVI